MSYVAWLRSVSGSWLGGRTRNRPGKLWSPINSLWWTVQWLLAQHRLSYRRSGCSMNYLASAKWPSVYLPSNRGGIRSIQEPRSISPSPDLSFLSMSNSVTGFLRLSKFVSGRIHELASRLWIVEIEQVDEKTSWAPVAHQFCRIHH